MTPPGMVFAAGFGTRMGPLTADRPKPLLTVAGRTLIDRALDRLVQGGIDRAVVNLHYRGEMIRAHLAGRTEPAIAFSDETPGILETGGGLRAALPLLGGGPIVTLNPDAVWTGGDPVGALRAAWAPGRMEALLLLVPHACARGHGGPGDFFAGDAGRLSRRGGRDAAPFIYTGAQILDPARVAAAPPGAFSLNRVWDAMLGDGTLFGLVLDLPWIDVGNPVGLAAAEAALA